jgi:hypothetical protein
MKVVSDQLKTELRGSEVNAGPFVPTHWKILLTRLSESTTNTSLREVELNSLATLSLLRDHETKLEVSPSGN